jgi:hypothetical protein
MNINIDQQPNKANGKVMAGAILLVIGSYLLLNKLNILLPARFFRMVAFDPFVLGPLPGCQT